MKCPGQDLRFVSAEDIVCPECGAAVEFFSDEQKRKCPSCGIRMTRDAALSCASWCASARECLGASRFDELVEIGALEPSSEKSE